MMLGALPNMPSVDTFFPSAAAPAPSPLQRPSLPNQHYSRLKMNDYEAGNLERHRREDACRCALAPILAEASMLRKMLVWAPLAVQSQPLHNASASIGGHNAMIARLQPQAQ